MKRIIFFLITNIAILFVINLILSLTGANKFITSNGLDYYTLLAFSAIIGFTGSFISLVFSKVMAKHMVGARTIQHPKTSEEVWLVETIAKLTSRAGLKMPEVAIYDGAPNAFATGPSKSNSMIAVSTELLNSMNKTQVEAVLAHEVSHIANGDMVTLTLIQGVVNTFVVFLSRVAGFFVDSAMRNSDDDDSRSPGFGYYIASMIFEILFGILASIVVCFFSRKREFAADAGSARLIGSNQPMIEALRTLGHLEAGTLPTEMAASGIAGKNRPFSLFSTHPPLEVRIEALQNNRF